MRHSPDIVDQENGTQPDARSRRKFGRVRQVTLTCNLGTIIDICADGMRVRCRRKPRINKPVVIKLKRFDLPGTLIAVPVWSKRLGLFSHEVGLRFETADAEVVQRLTSIAGCGGIRRMLANSAAAATSSPTTPTAEAA